VKLASELEEIVYNFPATTGKSLTDHKQLSRDHFPNITYTHSLTY